MAASLSLAFSKSNIKLAANGEPVGLVPGAFRRF
jgi:hypothetical protein